MVELIRLDERLIHGKVTSSWSKALPIDSILVVDDEVVKDSLSMKSMQMVASSLKNVRTFIKSTEDALAILTDPRAASRHILVIVRQLSTMLELVEKAPDIKAVNMGNYGRMLSSNKQRKDWFPDLSFDEEETVIAKKITETAKCPVYFQDLASSPKTDLKGFFH